MIAVAPMPNELAIAHEWRIAWVNGWMEQRQACTLIRDAMAPLENDAKCITRLHRLAIISGMSITEYARLHSMLPAIRVVSKVKDNYQHGAHESIKFSQVRGMNTHKKSAYCCSQCIHEDLDFWGFSWFRRTHHLIGVDWCPTHGKSLSKVDALQPFSRLPHHWKKLGKLTEVPIGMESPLSNEFLKKYVDLATTLLLQAQPFTDVKMHKMLGSRLSYLNHQLRNSKNFSISDILIKQAPEAWLLNLSEEWKTTNLYNRLSLLNRVVTVGLPVQKGQNYFLALAALYDSVDDAVFDLQSNTNNIFSTSKTATN